MFDEIITDCILGAEPEKEREVNEEMLSKQDPAWPNQSARRKGMK